MTRQTVSKWETRKSKPNIKKISPIPAKGRLSFWEYDYQEKTE